MEFLSNDLFVFPPGNDMGHHNLGKEFVASKIEAKVVTRDHPSWNRNRQTMDEVQFVILEIKAYTVGMGNRHDSLLLALYRVTARNVPKIKVALCLCVIECQMDPWNNMENNKKVNMMNQILL